MNKEFVPYNLSLKLKELGFNEPCFGFFNPTINKEVIIDNNAYGGFGLTGEHIISAPTFSQAFRWFRENYKLITYPQWRIDNTWDMVVQKLDGYKLLSGQSTLFISNKSTYEEAQLECLNKLIELVKEKSV